MRPDRNPWTKQQTATLRRMREDDYSFEEIAAETGHSKTSCIHMSYKLGIYSPRNRRVDARVPAKSAYTGRMSLRERAKSTMRPCLKCRMDFPSQGPHNRLCTSCRRDNDDTVFTVPAVVMR